MPSILWPFCPLVRSIHLYQFPFQLITVDQRDIYVYSRIQYGETVQLGSRMTDDGSAVPCYRLVPLGVCNWKFFATRSSLQCCQRNAKSSRRSSRIWSPSPIALGDAQQQLCNYLYCRSSRWRNAKNAKNILSLRDGAATVTQVVVQSEPLLMRTLIFRYLYAQSS